jgi:glycosyltransferase involved in cell wall biosynthesis
MRYHVLGLPHTITSPEYSACAFTSKVYKFCQMMLPRGHEVFHYGHVDSTVPCTTNFAVTNNDILKMTYGDYDYKKSFFQYSIDDLAHNKFFDHAEIALNASYQKGDIILPFWGLGHKKLIDRLPKDWIVVEPGIGYPSGPFCRWKVFESYAILHAYMGLAAVAHANPDWYNAVIPNYFRKEDFTYSEQKEDYFLYLGRVYDGKGVQIAIDVTKQLGKKLIIAGQTDGSVTFPEHVEYVGYADPILRAKLMSKAKGSFLPTLYLEPFGGVAVENLFSGTPIITTDWGAFSEYNTNGETGFRCHTLADFVDAARRVDAGEISSQKCREVAESRFTYDVVAPQYEKFFQDVKNVYEGDGWDTLT